MYLGHLYSLVGKAKAGIVFSILGKRKAKAHVAELTHFMLMLLNSSSSLLLGSTVINQLGPETYAPPSRLTVDALHMVAYLFHKINYPARLGSLLPLASLNR